MDELFDFFPFDMDSGPGFMAVFLLISVGLMLLGTVVRGRVARRIDAASMPEPVAAAVPPGGPPVPTQGEPGPRLTVGVLPRGEQLWMVAWLRAGRVGVAQTLVANAWAEGWLSSSPSDRRLLRFTGRKIPRDRAAVRFYDQLEQFPEKDLRPEDVLELATMMAKSMEPKLRHDVKLAGMVRSSADQWRLARVMLLFGALAEAVAVIRVVVREAQNPGALSSESMLLGTFAMFVVAPVFVVLALFRPSSNARKRYLEWLEDATLSLVGEVEGRRCKDPADVTLAAAVAGLAVVDVPSELGMVAATREVEPPAEAPTMRGCGGMGG